MFDLEREIQWWRRELLACGLGFSELEELEDHLRIDIEEQFRAGVALPEAFKTAAGRIGHGSELKSQFDQAYRGNQVTGQTENAAILVKVTTGLLTTGTIVCAAVYGVAGVEAALKTGVLLLSVIVLAFPAGVAWARSRKNHLDTSSTLMPINVFSPSAQQCLDLARGEALRLGHDFVGTEHLLLAVTSIDPGVLVRVLEKVGVTRGALRHEIEKRISGYTAQAMASELSFTPRLREALRFARKAAALDHQQIDARHVLLGLVKERGGVAGHVLRNLGLSVDNIRSSLT